MDLTETGFDFETMVRRAKDDPIGFAGVREELIRQLIDRSARPRELACLQLDLDAARYGVPPGVQSGEEMLDDAAGDCTHERPRSAVERLARASDREARTVRNAFGRRMIDGAMA